jgi:hypothetical protein
VPAFGNAKAQLGADEEAVTWVRRGLEANRNLAVGHFFLAAALAQLDRPDEARAAALSGLALGPSFTIRHYRVGAATDYPTYLAGRERICEGMRRPGCRRERQRRIEPNLPAVFEGLRKQGCRRSEATLKTRKRERVRCSSRFDWPVYPRLSRTMRTSSR